MDEIEKKAQAHIDALEAATHWSSTSRRFKDALLAGIAALRAAPAAAGVPDGRSSAARTAGGRLDVLLRAVEKYGKASLTLGGSPLSKREYYDAQTRRDLAWKEAETVAKSMAEDLLMLAPEQRAVSEDVRRDAERYRWLRDEAICFPYDVEIESAWCVFGLNCSGSDPRPIEGRELDEAIDAARRFAETDAAMAAQPQGEEVR